MHTAIRIKGQNISINQEILPHDFESNSAPPKGGKYILMSIFPDYKYISNPEQDGSLTSLSDSA
jgi:hypothetical protein